jgi:hypothetical protein
MWWVKFGYFCEIPKWYTTEHLLEINLNAWVLLVLVLIFFLLIKISVRYDFGESVWSSIVCIARRSGVRIQVVGDFHISIHIQPPLHWTTWVNGWPLIVDKTNIVKFSSKHYQDETFLINYQNNSIKESTNTRFLGLELDKHINWENHINKILDLCTPTVTCPFSND